MDSTTIAISLEGALLIGASIIGTGFAIWKASRDAHKDIRAMIDSVINEQCSVKVALAAMSTDIRWLVKLQGGEPHGDQGS